MRANRAITALAAATALATSASAVDAPGVPAPPAELAAVPVYMAVDAGSGQVLTERKPALSFVPASLTKVMTAYVAFELIAAGKLKPEQTFAFAPASYARWHGKGTAMNLRSGEAVPVDDLLHGITTVSANDACIVLAEGYAGSIDNWAALMNAEAARLGMKDSHFATPNGWPDGGKTYVSARDLIVLGQALIQRHPDLYRRYFGHKTLTWNGVTQQNHDPTVGVIRGADGIKTGHTVEAGYGFLGSALRDGRRLLFVIAGAHSEDERASAARALMEWGYAAWDSRPLFPAGAVVASGKVQNGDARSVRLLAPRAVTATLPNGRHPAITLQVYYRGPLIAPIAKGANVAELEIAVAGQQPSRLPLVAGDSVGTAGPIDRLVNGLAQLLP